jgi:hypothetical protein
VKNFDMRLIGLILLTSGLINVDTGMC